MSMTIAWAARAAGPFGLAVCPSARQGRVEADEQPDDEQPTEET